MDFLLSYLVLFHLELLNEVHVFLDLGHQVAFFELELLYLGFHVVFGLLELFVFP